MNLDMPSLVRLVRNSGQILKRHFCKVDVRLKDDRSPVTAADTECEAFLKGSLNAIVPGAAFIGEETVDKAAMQQKAASAEAVWVVDPLDGTAGFVDGLLSFGVSVGLLVNGSPHAGVVHFPLLDETYWAATGKGAFFNDGQAAALTPETRNERSALLISSDTHRRHRLQFEGKIRSMASTAYHYCLVARGAAIGAISAPHIWDIAGVAPILTEAGAALAHLDGSEIRWPDWLDGRNLDPAVLGAPDFAREELVAALPPL